MSIKVMSYVWDGFPGAGSELLAMLALADWCNDHGGSLYPSVGAVAEKIRVGEKHARNILHKFIKDGFLAVTANPHGGKPGTTRHYRLNVPKLKALADAKDAQETPDFHPDFQTAPLEVTPNPQFLDGSPVVTKTAPLEVTLSTIEPPVEPPEKKKKEAQAQKESEKIVFHEAAFHNISADQTTRWTAAFPAVNVAIEILKAAAWIDANPANKKSDYKRFLTGWLTRAQDRAPRVQAGAGRTAAAMTPGRRNSPTGTQNTHKHAAAAATIYEGVWDAE